VLEFDGDRSILIRETTNRHTIYYAVKGITAGEARSFVRYLDILPCIGAYTDCRKTYCGSFSPIVLPLWKYLSVLYTQIPRWTASLSPRNFVNYLLPHNYHEKPVGPFQVGSDVRMDAQSLVAVFYSNLDPTPKTMSHDDMMAGRTHVLVSSEAYGLGMDVDVVRVVQWGVSKIDSMDTIVQRFGRAGRNTEKQAMCVLYVERFTFSQKSPVRNKMHPLSHWLLRPRQKLRQPPHRKDAAAGVVIKGPIIERVLRIKLAAQQRCHSAGQRSTYTSIFRNIRSNCTLAHSTIPSYLYRKPKKPTNPKHGISKKRMQKKKKKERKKSTGNIYSSAVSPCAASKLASTPLSAVS
jgi:hypothetical protein